MRTKDDLGRSAPPNQSPSGATRAGLDQLWARFKRSWRRLLSPRALVELKLRASFDIDLIAPWRIANKVPRGTIPDCPSCDDICCAGVENVVSLRLVDIAMLIDLGRTDLIAKKKPCFPAHMLRSRPLLHELVGSELWRALPVLRQIGDRRICVALAPDLRCSLHPDWPTSCERFPYTLSRARRAVTWGTRCPSKKCGPDLEMRSDELFHASIDAYNERVRDSVLIAHAPSELHALGIGPWLTRPDEDPFEPRNPRLLPIVE